MSDFDAPGVVLVILEQISKDEFLAIVPNSPGYQLQQLALQMLKKSWREFPLQQCASDMLQLVLDSLEELNRYKCSSAGENAAIKMIHANRRCISTAWVQALSSLGLQFPVDIFNILAQNVLDRMLPIIASQLTSLQLPNQSTRDPPTYTDLPLEEKQVLHYAAGYVPRKLLRRYSRSPNNKAAQLFSDVVQTWVTHADDEDDATLCDAITYWTRLQDRGGLLHCKPEFFHFMKIVEFNVQHILNKDTLPEFAGKDIVTEVGSLIKSNTEVLHAYKKLLKDKITSEELCDILLDQVLTSWIACKARQVTKQYIFKMKQSKTGNMSRMGTPALRKTVDKH